MWVRVAIAVVLLLLPTAAFAQAEMRVALVIGNSAYQHTPKLANPTNDAADMSAALKKHGFKVIEGFDLDKPAFDRKVRDFATTLKQAEAGVFFYAGHGLQVAGILRSSESMSFIGSWRTKLTQIFYSATLAGIIRWRAT